MTTSMRSVSIGAAGLLSVSAAAPGAIVPFTEHFATDSANWYDAAGAMPLMFNPAGGPDGSSYASGTFNFVGSAADDTPALHRAQDEFDSSNHAFEGDWVTEGVTEFSAYVRHDAPVPLTYFTRFSGPGNFPGAAAVHFVPVLPNTWTQISVGIFPGNPAFVFEGPSNFFNVFGNVGHIQIGVIVPGALAGQDTVYTFEVDQPTIIPAPGAALAGLAGLIAAARRRRT